MAEKGEAGRAAPSAAPMAWLGISRTPHRRCCKPQHRALAPTGVRMAEGVCVGPGARPLGERQGESECKSKLIKRPNSNQTARDLFHGSKEPGGSLQANLPAGGMLCRAADAADLPPSHTAPASVSTECWTEPRLDVFVPEGCRAGTSKPGPAALLWDCGVSLSACRTQSCLEGI